MILVVCSVDAHIMYKKSPNEDVLMEKNSNVKQKYRTVYVLNKTGNVI